MGRKRERTQRHSNVYSSSYCNRFPHNEIVIIHKARCKRIYKVPVLKAQGGMGGERAVGANPMTLGANGGFTKACSGVCAFQMQAYL